jgi:hypothetical protein
LPSVSKPVLRNQTRSSDTKEKGLSNRLLRGTTDYWVNAMDGRPFFVVSYPVDPGLLNVLEHNIVPRLRAEAPGQPSQERLAAEPLSSAFASSLIGKVTHRTSLPG